MNSVFKKGIEYLSHFPPTRIIVLGFALIILIGTALLALPVASRNGESVGWIQALFTATSATCVTGLLLVDTCTYWTVFGQLVILLLIQTGGLGFMTVATLFSFALRRKITLKERLLMVESLNQHHLSGIVRLSKHILLGTLFFESVGGLLLSVKFIREFGVVQGIYKSVFHSVSAFCNAGFDLMGEKEQFSSLVSYVDDPFVNLTIMALVVVGGLGFSVWTDIYGKLRCHKRNSKMLSLHTKLVLSITAILLIVGFLFFFIVEYDNPDTLGALDFKGKVFAAMFQSVSTRTAGFYTVPVANMTNASKFMTALLMFIGGSPGSTAGGIKTTTLGVLFFAVISVLKGKNDVELFKRRINLDTVLRALAIVMIGLTVVVVGIILLLIFERADFMDVFFDVVSAFTTVGLTLRRTNTLALESKIILIIIMFFGKVGVLTTALALTEGTHKRIAKYRYPEDKIMVG